MMLKQLRRKFVLVTMGIVLALLGILFGLIYYFTKSDMVKTRQRDLSRIEAAVTKPVAIENLPRDVVLPYFVVFTGPYGQYVAAGYTDYDLNDETFLRRLVTQAESGEKTGTLGQYQLLYSVCRSKGGTAIAFLDISSQTATLETLVGNCLLIGIVGICLFLALSILLSRWMIRPVEQAWQQQKQFVSDASHELKTPLTVIISNAELLQSGEGDKEQFTNNILTMSGQMRNLVEGLLELARADNGQVRKSFEPVDFSTLISESVLPFEPVYFEKGLHLRTRIQPGIQINGNGPYLRQVAEILLDNACKYTEKGIVDLQLEKRGRQCLLSVSNPGTPIPEEDLEKIFERFYRSDKARSRTGSFGLGLSIAQSVVREHQGKIWAESNPTGNCILVELPCL